MTFSPPTSTTPSPGGLGDSIQLSPTTTLVDDLNELSPIKSRQPFSSPKSKLDEIFEIHDMLVNDTSEFTNIVSIGGQSAGKSTVLSSITNTPLWSSGGRATVCPTQMHSRYRPFEAFNARIEIQISHPVNEHIPSRIAYTGRSLTEIDKLANAVRMAGLQAKRFGDGSHGPITTYEEMMLWSSDERERWLDEQSRSRDGLRFTDNVVILHVSGPAQPNLSVIDMPGLVGDPLVRTPGSGRDLSSEDIEFSLIQKYDPQAKRSIFVVTKVDQMGLPRAFEDRLEHPESDPNWTLKPAHGWWFVSPKTEVENEMGTHGALSRQREAQLFREAKWDKLKKMPGFHYGTDNLRRFVYEIFSDLVVKHVDSLKHLLTIKTSEPETRLAQLPPEIDAPIEEVHNIIDSVSRSIDEAMKTERAHTRRPFELQRDLPLQLGATLPTFMPFRKADSENQSAVDFAEASAESTSDEAETAIFIDEVYDIVRKYTNPRDLLAIHRIKPHYIVVTASKWHEICDKHVHDVWRVVIESVDQVMGDTCSHHNLATRMKSILRDKAGEFIDQCLAISEQYCKGELEEPSLIDIPENGAKARIKMIDAYSKAYQEIYASVPSTPSTTDHDAQSAAGIPPAPMTTLEPSSPLALAPPSVIPLASTVKWPPADLERRWCFYLMASSTVWLQAGVERLAMILGRAVQASIRSFLKDISSMLRRELGLVKVSMDVEEETRRLLEPDEKVVKEREGLKKRKREFEVISHKFKRIQS